MKSPVPHQSTGRYLTGFNGRASHDHSPPSQGGAGGVASRAMEPRNSSTASLSIPNCTMHPPLARSEFRTPHSLFASHSIKRPNFDFDNPKTPKLFQMTNTGKERMFSRGKVAILIRFRSIPLRPQA